ncbi:hypothetical protein PG989_010201 [Apiospora arundinis]
MEKPATILTPDVTGAATQGNGTSPAGGRPAIILVPWDPDSPDHVERMRLQRVACGWKQDGAESWRPLQREGKIGLHWIRPPPASRLTKPSSRPKRRPSGTRAAAFSGGGTRCPPEIAGDGDLFVPVGHISLDGWHADPSLQTSAADGVYSLTTFYVSKAMQGVGIGGAAVAECERMAVEDFGAKTMTLDTISNEDIAVDSPRRIALKRPILKITNQDWYMRRGYEVYHRRPNAWFDTDATGKEWWCTAVCLRKNLV